MITRLKGIVLGCVLLLAVVLQRVGETPLREVVSRRHLKPYRLTDSLTTQRRSTSHRCTEVSGAAMQRPCSTRRRSTASPAPRLQQLTGR